MSDVTIEQLQGFAGSTLRIPALTRLKAWWNGYDPVELHRLEAPRPAPAAAAAPPSPTDSAQSRPAARREAASDDPGGAESWAWWPERIELGERLWGPGFNTPGGTEHVLELVRPMALDKTMSVLDLGCGLGGATRTIATECGSWVTGVEWWKEITVAAVDRSTRAGLERKAAVQFLPGRSLTLKPASYQAIFSKEALFTVPDKANLFAMIASALRPGGKLCLTDYVLPAGANEEDAVLEAPSVEHGALAEWRAREPLGAHPWSVSRIVRTLETNGLDVRIAEDLSQTHRQLIKAGWDALEHERIAGSAPPAPWPLLIREAEIWARRTALLKVGRLKVYRIFAIKP